MNRLKVKSRKKFQGQRGVVLLVTLVLLIVLSMLGYTLSSYVAMQRHRNQYIVDYQAAVYARDSAIKYALTRLQEINPELISRPNEPDFSDVFAYTEEEYQDYLENFVIENDYAGRKSFGDGNNVRDVNNVFDVNLVRDIVGGNDINGIGGFGAIADFNGFGFTEARGPYGFAWPLVAKPIELEIGTVKIKIEIEDENAKYPICWALLGDEEKDEPELKDDALAGFETFCEWMEVDDVNLLEQLEQIAEIKAFKFELKPINIKAPRNVRGRSSRGRGRRSRNKNRRGSRKSASNRRTITVSEQISDYAKLFHGSIIDTETLARPTIISSDRKESALKYMGMWGSRTVNVNTAPRNVLEATFKFGGSAELIAEEIIEQRRIEPFASISELRQSLLRYSNSIQRCERYLTVTSSFFTIRVTATSGVAKASAVVAIIKEGDKVERIAVLSG